MQELDDIVSKWNKCNEPIFIQGARYNGNNPYVMNEINNLLAAGVLTLAEVSLGPGTQIEKRIGGPFPYLFHPQLEALSNQIDDEFNNIKRSKRDYP